MLVCICMYVYVCLFVGFLCLCVCEHLNCATLQIIEGLWSEGHLAQPSFEFGSEKVF